ncbi:MAG: RibD family protein [Sphaerospermopsis sp. SIO1G2]|nr:RibD family protein [Sphaerospermopsis sp. SIO1G1]NET70258.1 RibD family protein [Sphaerospermopsis sp. SIO1G2]
MMQKLPHTTVVLAMSADGKIADFQRSPARFGSTADKIHLETQIAAADAILFGAGTLRAYGTTLTISDPNLLQQRITKNKSPQPFHLVISGSGNINPDIKFFQQPIKRWLLTTETGAKFWQARSEFEQILVIETINGKINTLAVWQHLESLQIQRLAVLGGGELVASLLEFNLIDELWLTVCPLILGGNTAPTPVSGLGFRSNLAPKLQLLEVNQVNQEIFLHYRIDKSY